MTIFHIRKTNWHHIKSCLFLDILVCCQDFTFLSQSRMITTVWNQSLFFPSSMNQGQGPILCLLHNNYNSLVNLMHHKQQCHGAHTQWQQHQNGSKMLESYRYSTASFCGQQNFSIHIQFLLKYTYKYTYAHLARGMIIFSINGLFVTLNCTARYHLPAKATNVITFNNEL